MQNIINLMATVSLKSTQGHKMMNFYDDVFYSKLTAFELNFFPGPMSLKNSLAHLSLYAKYEAGALT